MFSNTEIPERFLVTVTGEPWDKEQGSSKTYVIFEYGEEMARAVGMAGARDDFYLVYTVTAVYSPVESRR